ncbi:hypothetical protein H0E87_012337 [Populus deltoides]|uniref:Translation initiation factor IF-3 n=1 Tax=Populus deltoides TaxID=3696 RepID=A0A8T2YJ46_POPDE|nr:hypothetical protein H0E87_012337 [Populus deltoides]
MAGITSTSGSSCFPPLTRITATKTAPYILSLSAIRAPIPHFSQPRHHLHYGGPRSYGDSRRPRKSDSDEDQALDKSRISSATVRLIDQQQNIVGVVSVHEAIQMAEDAELDLVIVVTRCRSSGCQDNGLQGIECLLSIVEPVPLYLVVLLPNAICLIQWLHFDLYNIDQHDYDVRLRAARNFLKDGDKVKVIVNLNWRENEFGNIAIELIRRFQNFVGELATEESKNFHDRNIFISLVPNKAILQKALEPPKKKDKSAANEVSAGMSACKFTRGFNYGTLGRYSRSHFADIDEDCSRTRPVIHYK